MSPSVVEHAAQLLSMRITLTSASYFTDALPLPTTFDELRTSPHGRVLNPLIAQISDNCHHPAIVSALLYA